MWTLVDEQLCGLVGRLCTMGYHHTLEVEVRLARIEGDLGKYDFTKILPGFREKGTVTIVDTAHGNRRLHHSSARNR